MAGRSLTRRCSRCDNGVRDCGLTYGRAVIAASDPSPAASGNGRPTTIFAFLIILAISLIASIVVCFFTAPEKNDVLKSFYRTVRPWGFWRPIYEKLCAENPNFRKNEDFRRDLFNLAVGLVWQTSMVALPIYLVIQQYGRMWISLLVFAGTSLILKFTWYDRLGRGEMYLTEDR